MWTSTAVISGVFVPTRYGLERCIVNARTFLLLVLLAAFQLTPATARASEPVRLLALGDSLAAGFDRLRKQYPFRRDFHGWDVNCPDSHSAALLSALEFKARVR